MTEPPLPTLPAGFAATREAAHRLAVYVIAPARRRATGRIGLRASPGGFATPAFGEGERVRLDLGRLVRERAGSVESAPVTTLAAAAAFVLGGPPDTEGAEGFDVPPPGDPDAPLAIGGDASAFLAAWYAFAFDVLGTLRDGPGLDDPSEIQLWPEHFDAAFDAAVAGGRATFGASPGDATYDAPYLYVLPPGPVPRDEVWNAVGFTGAALPLPAFAGAADQRGTALGFLRGRLAAIGDG